MVEGIAKKPMEKSLRDFVGDFNYLGNNINSNASSAGADGDAAADAPDPSLAQVRQAVNEYCILPMGSRDVHLYLNHNQYEEGFGKSLLLHGPPGVGKTLLVHAIAAECGMLIFDLSPKTTDGLYKGAKEKGRMVQKVFTVRRPPLPTPPHTRTWPASG